MRDQLLALKNEALSIILAADSAQEIESLRLRFFGKQGLLTRLLKHLPTLPEDEKGAAGRLANEVKKVIHDTLEERLTALTQQQARTLASSIDTTEEVLAPTISNGHIHLISQAIDEITEIFERIGMVRVRHKEIEWDWYAFTALNFPDNHPARDDWETFFVEETPHETKGRMILTPHTSSGQIRQMENSQPPIRMINIAKTYRRQADTRHTMMFHQFEGLVVDHDISIVHLRGVLEYFMKSFFGHESTFRIRPYHFPFTEPSFEVDVTCGICHGTGRTKDESCRTCKAGWVELGGAGIVHPNVLRHGGIDPAAYGGFAFGWGVERCIMVKTGIPDTRLLYSTDIRILNQY